MFLRIHECWSLYRSKCGNADVKRGPVGRDLIHDMRCHAKWLGLYLVTNREPQKCCGQCYRREATYSLEEREQDHGEVPTKIWSIQGRWMNRQMNEWSSWWMGLITSAGISTHMRKGSGFHILSTAIPTPTLSVHEWFLSFARMSVSSSNTGMSELQSKLLVLC